MKRPIGFVCALAVLLTSLPVATLAAPQEGATQESSSDFDSMYPSFLDRVTLNYYGLFHGPSVDQPGSFRVSDSGVVDRRSPIVLKNWFAVGYALSENVAVSGTLAWDWIPVLGQRVDMEDPYARISHDSLWSVGNFNLAADFRVHFPITRESRNLDMLSGLQSFQIWSWSPNNSRLSLGSYTSQRFNIYGSQGEGEDFELYAAPFATYRFIPKLAATLMVEMGSKHVLGQSAFDLDDNGTDIEPGLSWDVTQRFNVSPYLNIPTSDGITLAATSFEMTMTYFLY